MWAFWPELLDEIGKCEKCRLCQGRTNAVPGEGNPNADIMFIGEGPGRDEDMQGRPFVGASGQLLDRMIHAIGMERTEVYIANIVKCRPPMNRNPEPDEAQACMNYLRNQFVLVSPKIIVLLGRVASKFVLGDETPISRLRGNWILKKGIWFMPTYHPSALLREPSKKREAWEDFKMVKAKLLEVRGNGEIQN
ncbi:MAG: uracil-DNA glycosylase [Clostridia bacterium]|nr:uracil-DNA glycosylase [Clostridia bacterium]